VINGDHDVIVYTINSYILQQNIPDRAADPLPGRCHGSLYQYPERFVRTSRCSCPNKALQHNTFPNPRSNQELRS